MSNAESIDDSSSHTMVSLKLMRIECDRFQAATTLNVVILIIAAVSTHTVTVQTIQWIVTVQTLFSESSQILELHPNKECWYIL